MKIKTVLIAILFLSRSIGVHATPGVSQAQSHALGIQSDGTVIAVGCLVHKGVTQSMLARYTPFGTIDLTYGNYGYVTTPIGSSSAANAVAILSNDQAVVVGLKQSVSGNSFLIARYKTDGTLDPQFNKTGIQTTTIGHGAVAYDLAVDSKGNYVVAGTAISALDSNPSVTLVRYTNNGVLDTNFGSNGIVTTDIHDNSGANSVVIQTDGKILIGGYTITPTGTRQFALVRYTTNGSLDTSFNHSGIVTTQIGTDACAQVVILQANGQIIAGGVSDNRFTLVRYTSNGSLDTSFGTRGVATTSLGSTAQINDITLTSEGKIIAAGFSDNQFALARYNSNGSLDTSFGSGGIVTTHVGFTAIAKSVIAQNNGQIVVGGYFNYGAAVVRYTADGILDASFGTNGMLAFPRSVNAPDIVNITNSNISNTAGISYTKLDLQGSLVNDDINNNADIEDTKLQIIQTPGKVLNQATTATSFNVPNGIVARDTLGDFSAHMIQATLNGNVIGSASNNVLKAGDTLSGPLVLTAGTPAQPALQFADSAFSGFSADSGTITISTNGRGRISVDNNGAVVVTTPVAGTALTIEGGGAQIEGDISNSGTIAFNTESMLLNAVGSTQGTLVKIFTGVGYIGLSGSVNIDYAAAGFTSVPVICANPISGVLASLSINTITSSSAAIVSSAFNVPFNYIAIGI